MPTDQILCAGLNGPTIQELLDHALVPRLLTCMIERVWNAVVVIVGIESLQVVNNILRAAIEAPRES